MAIQRSRLLCPRRTCECTTKSRNREKSFVRFDIRYENESIMSIPYQDPALFGGIQYEEHMTPAKHRMYAHCEVPYQRHMQYVQDLEVYTLNLASLREREAHLATLHKESKERNNDAQLVRIYEVDLRKIKEKIEMVLKDVNEIINEKEILEGYINAVKEEAKQLEAEKTAKK